MMIRPPFEWPRDMARQRERAIRLEWWTIGWLLSIIIVLYLTMGSSQAMRAAWLDDILGLLPAAAFLIAVWIEREHPSRNFPFGKYRSISIAYLVAATATLLLGLYIFYESVKALISQEHPTIGLTSIFGFELWSGWLMIAGLIYSMVPPIILGRMKMPIAREIHDKVLVADASMQKADWMTAVAAIAGIIGIGFGLWWADAVAAGLISLDIVRDGGTHVWRAAKDLADQLPRTVESAEEHPSIRGLCDAVMKVPWVVEADLRLREEGHCITGVIYVVPDPAVDAIGRVDEIKAAAHRADWRIYDPEVCFVRSLRTRVREL